MYKQATLHYIYDPFCGWCYGLAPLVSAADEAGLRVVPHSGGMLAGERAQNMSAEWRDFVRPHEERITALSGQPTARVQVPPSAFTSSKCAGHVLLSPVSIGSGGRTTFTAFP